MKTNKINFNPRQFPARVMSDDTNNTFGVYKEVSSSNVSEFQDLTKGRIQKKKTDNLVTLIKLPLTPTHHPPRMTYERMTRCWKVYHPPTLEKQ